VSFWNSQRAHPAKSIFGFEQALTPAATAAASSVEQNFTITKSPVVLLATDIVQVTGPSSSNNVTIGNARINSSGQLTISFVNPTAGSLTHAAGTFKVVIFRL
jgi:hypothetical protein